MPLLEFGIPVFITLFIFYSDFDFGSVQIYAPAPFVVTIKFSIPILFGLPQRDIPLRWFRPRVQFVNLLLFLCGGLDCLFFFSPGIFSFLGSILKMGFGSYLVERTGDDGYFISSKPPSISSPHL